MNDIQNSFLPGYIGLGFRRCATTWLHNCLFEHPEIGHYRGKHVWGAHFFSNDENYLKGSGYYVKQFEAYSGNKIYGELSDSYTYPEYYEKVAERIYRHCPDVRLFCIIRNPVDRAFSDYLRSVKIMELGTDITFEKAVEMDKRLIERGFYAQILKNYKKYRNDDRLLVLVNEHIQSDSQRFIGKLYHYLGVDDAYIPSIISKKVGRAYMLRSSGMQKFISDFQGFLSPLFRKTGFGFILDSIKRMGVQRAVLNLNRKEKNMSRVTRKRLSDIYAQDIRNLESMFDIDLSVWEKVED